MPNQAWWTHLAIFNLSHQKCFRTIESLFASNRSQIESEKNDTEDEQCINQEERDEDQKKRKNHELSRKLTCKITQSCLRYEKEETYCYFCWKWKLFALKTQVFLFVSLSPITRIRWEKNLLVGLPVWMQKNMLNNKIIAFPPKNKTVPQNFNQGDKLSPSDQILAQILYLKVLYQIVTSVCMQ